MPSFWDKVPVDGLEMAAHVSTPTGPGPFPAVVVIHPASGVGEFTRSIADRLALEGYAAVAPDLFHRVTEEMRADGSPPTQFLDDGQIIDDVNATVGFLLRHSSINDDRIGIIGFCMGGRITWLGAATNPHFKAAVPYYGGNIMVTRGSATQTPFDLAGGIGCPVLFHFGELDLNPSRVDMQQLDAELTRLDVQHQFHSYPGADHAFMDSTGGRYHRQAAEDSWPRTLEFLAQHLKGAPVSR